MRQCVDVFVSSTEAQEKGGGAWDGDVVGVGVMSECDQTSVVPMLLAPPPQLCDHTQDKDWADRMIGVG